MKVGTKVSLPTPVLGGELGKFLAHYGGDKEVYCRIEGGMAVLYLVIRREHGKGELFASRDIPLLPKEV